MTNPGNLLANKKILISGAHGFTGSNLIKILANTNLKIIPLVRKNAGLKNEVVTDFCDPNFYTVVNSLPKVDAIVHLGAKISWYGGSKCDLFVPNVFATSVLLEWANRIGAYFLFTSSAIVCGVRNPYITANSKPNPDTDYGYSKWLAEEVIRFSEVKHAILRIAGIFGLNGPKHLGINKAINNALNGSVPVQEGSGKMKRSYIYVKDLCEIIKFCIENEIEGTQLVAGSSVNTISEMLQIICDTLLPGRRPEHREGIDGNDQVVEHSPHLPKGRSFEAAIKDIKHEYYKRCASIQRIGK